MKEKERKILEKHFRVYEDRDSHYIGLEQLTAGGVDMWLDIDKNKDISEQLEEYAENFDIDEEIDLHRQGKEYREHFTIRQSLEDFEDWIEFIENIIKELRGEKENENR